MPVNGVLFAADPDLIRHGVAVPKWGAVRSALGRIGKAEAGIRPAPPSS